MKRRAMVVGNWKMNGLIETAQELAQEILEGLMERENRQLLCEVVLCPPFTALYALHAPSSSSLKLGAQNMSPEPGGAFTGEICGLMLRNVGCRYVILGHSERRIHFGESDALIARKLEAAFRDGLIPIACLGENLADREEGRTLDVVDAQLQALLTAIPEGPQPARQQMVLAYEPVWAIGTGHNATPEQVQEVHRFLRQRLSDTLGEELGGRMRILYGGSLKPQNAAAIFAQPDVDGGLVGGASLKAAEFLAIIDAVSNPKEPVLIR
ncbi:MAG: triose-phosphate isomerase [Magnetococcales bacterium]|nr:triose-phosphate isomerase [Magnetococcales bacterium]